jgi:hypothetical protein
MFCFVLQGQLVYVARGLAEDWLELEHDKVAIEGKIVVASTDALYPEDIVSKIIEPTLLNLCNFLVVR